MSPPPRLVGLRKGAPALFALPIALSAMLSCTAAPLPPTPTDAESAARLLLTARLFESPELLQPLFVPDRQPAVFPLRMMAAGPEELVGARIDRLRLIDGRAVVTARVSLDGLAQHFEFWLERHEGLWRVAGWAPTPRPLADADAPVPEAPADPPAELLGPFLRSAHPVHSMPLVTAVAAAALGSSTRVEVQVKSPAVTGTCKPAEIAAAVDHTTPALATCYRTALTGAPARWGRITWRLQYSAAQPTPAVTLVESTLLLTGLPECVSAALAGARLSGRTCTATVPIVFKPDARAPTPQ